MRPLRRGSGWPRNAGFDYIEFWSWTDKDIPRIKELCHKHDLGIASFSGDQSLSLIDENRQTELSPVR